MLMNARCLVSVVAAVLLSGCAAVASAPRTQVETSPTAAASEPPTEIGLRTATVATITAEQANNADLLSDEQEVAILARHYLRLTLEAGTYEDGYIDAYYGPAAEQSLAQAERRSRAALVADAQTLVRLVEIVLSRPSLASRTPEPPYSPRRRLLALRGMLVAAETRLRMIGGERLSFADEARGLFGVDVTTRPLSDFDPILAQLERSIPGTGSLASRVDAFNERYTIPADRLRPVMDAAIAECRRRTMAHMTLPEGESFTLEFVTDKPWSGYNYYQGNYRSLIQINTDLPVRISRAVDLGCHEGYSGHHVLNLMVESRMARGPADGVAGGRGWREYLVNPLYSPTSVLSEGSANYGIDLAFSPAERLVFEREVLYPLAGLDPATAQAYWQLQQATEALSGARLSIAQQYLDGAITRGEAVALTQRYLLLSPARAEQSVAFTDHYRSYVLNYGWGRDLVRGFVERGAPDGTPPDAAERWRRIVAILSEPTLPGDLIVR
jgi:hypothetical protein